MVASNTNSANALQQDIVAVGKLFVQRYYKLLALKPEEMHKFFKESSSLSRINKSTEKAVSANGIEDINKVFATLDLINASFHFTSVEVQPSLHDGIFIVVHGYTHKGDTKFPFVEAFFLAPQDPGYYVHNAVFRNLDEKPVTARHEVTHHEESHHAAPCTLR
eukprot:TRINITY_DN4577_c0_g1::TRINITY_DN4577_c0_g1_i1::g.23174::m.23174 TRINITY_DN4577_c0_g1::TRINITY_DN4577_c0_g1_i1::g.23174  ORF type:complete len:163 (-),score=43.15,sp/O94260/G3BP_SCHPO/34.43/1e-11,NTF2/PF02136.15/1.7e-19,NTF2/PF02136.15/9.7e+03 TRINITY_DN4577_c0_g1_i1:1-489(-)